MSREERNVERWGVVRGDEQSELRVSIIRIVPGMLVTFHLLINREKGEEGRGKRAEGMGNGRRG